MFPLCINLAYIVLLLPVIQLLKLTEQPTMEEVLGKYDLVDCYYDRPSVFLKLHITDILMTWKNKHNKPTAIHLSSH
jgi:hypothetical protein